MIQHDPALFSAALAAAERALNQAIAMAPTSHQELDVLSGTLLGIEIVDESDRTVDMQVLARRSWERRARRVGLIVESTPEEVNDEAAGNQDADA